jgi:hypothetical protein
MGLLSADTKDKNYIARIAEKAATRQRVTGFSLNTTDLFLGTLGGFQVIIEKITSERGACEVMRIQREKRRSLSAERSSE